MSTDSPLLAYLTTKIPTFRKARLPALYSDFTSLRTLNPDGYHANVQTWTNGLSSALKSGVLPPNQLVLSLDESLFQSLETKECGRPLALDTVVSEALSRRAWMGLSEFQNSRDSIYRKWTIPTLGDVLGWGLKQLGLGFSGTRGGKGTSVVVLTSLEEAGRSFEAMINARGQRGRVESIWSLAAFKAEFADLLSTSTTREAQLSSSDFEVLLVYLRRDKGLLSYDGTTIKLRSKNEGDGITEEDTTIANLKTLISDLALQTKLLESKIDELNTTARTAVQKKNRTSALSVLRSKKLAESTLVKRHATLAQLEEVLSSIEQAADQVELVRVMEGSRRVLEGLNRQVGGVEKVDSVLDGLREEMGKVDELGGVIAEAGQTGVDESEVDDELEAMEAEQRRKFEETEKEKREEKERKEAEETKRKLDALGEVERAAREKAEMEKGNEKEGEKGIDESLEGLKRISLDPTENIPA